MAKVPIAEPGFLRNQSSPKAFKPPFRACGLDGDEISPTFSMSMTEAIFGAARDHLVCSAVRLLTPSFR
jgi:hypothetical protein